jgi:hypothetical protein
LPVAGYLLAHQPDRNRFASDANLEHVIRGAALRRASSAAGWSSRTGRPRRPADAAEPARWDARCARNVGVSAPDSLPVTLYLLSYRPERNRFGRAGDLEYVLRGAALIDLTMRGCLKDDTGSPTPTSKIRTEDPVLDEFLRDIREDRPRSWRGWIRRPGRSRLRGVQDQLAKAGVIEVTPHRVLGLFPGRRITLRQPELARAAREAAQATLHGDQPAERVEQRAAAVVALAAAGQLAFGLRERRQHSKRITALGRRADGGVPALAYVLKQVRLSRAAAHNAAS